jgi:hypothetical protein
MKVEEQQPKKLGRPFKYEGGCNWRMYTTQKRVFTVTELDKDKNVLRCLSGARLATLAPAFNMSVRKLYSINERNNHPTIKVTREGGKHI